MTTRAAVPAWLTLRWLVPLAMLGVALAGGTVVVAVTFVVLDQTMRANAEQEASRLVRTLSRALVEPVLRRDVWQVYQLVRAAGSGTPDALSEIVVIDDDDRVLAAAQPLRYPVGAHLSTLPPAWQGVARAAVQSSVETERVATIRGPDALVMATPIVAEEGSVLGVVLAVHGSGLSTQQRRALAQRLGLIGLLTLAAVALGGAVLGWRLTRPITLLRDSMAQVESQGLASAVRGPSAALTGLLHRRDEVGDLARAYVAMLRRLEHQRQLERHLLEAERLARVGQLSAALAHEINNPIGGLLAALENRRLRGDIDAHSARTFDVIERGLHHLVQTVGAVLNEARAGQHPMGAADLRDVHTLLEPVCQRAGVALQWQLAPPAGAVPAVAARQVLLNLGLNAVQAAGRGGRVGMWAQDRSDAWCVSIGNTGAALAAEDFDALVGGRHWHADERAGLGLWVSARLVADAGGQLRLAAHPDWATVIEVAFPAHAGATWQGENGAGRSG